MNWTGGRLSRHSRNANSSLIHRQKQHFAKARINHLNGPQKTSPATWSVFDKVQGAARGDSLKLSTTPHLAGHNQPDVGQKDRSRSQKSERSENNLKSTLPEATFQGEKRSGFGREPNGESLTNGGSRLGVYQKTRSISDAVIGKKQAPSVETADGMNVVNEADSLEERRRRILRRIDWVGANIQHPIKLRFTVIENGERLGKRRRITARHQSQFGAIVQPMVTSPFAKPRQKQRIHGSLGTQNANGDSSEALPTNHVRISIGGRHVGAGVASNTSHSKTVGGHFVTSQASTPDVMLLDGDNMSRQQRQQLQEGREHLSYPASPLLAPSSAVGEDSTFSASTRNLPINTPHRKKILTHYNGSNPIADQRAAAAFFDLERRIPAVRTRLNDSAVDVGPQFEERINNLREPSYQHTAFVAKCNPNLAILRGCGIENDPGFTNLKHVDANEIQDSESSSHNARYITDISKQLSASARKLQSVTQEKLQRTAQVNSQPQLFHPIPLSSRTSQVLSRTSSEADTAVVQVGVEPVVTRSQILDEEIWKTWVLSSKNDLASASENERDDGVSISPGISNFGYRYIREDSKQTIKGDARCIRSFSEVNSIDYTSDQEREQSKFKSSMDIEDENNRKEILPNVQESANHEDLPPTKEVMDYKALFLQGPQEIPSPPKPNPVGVDNRDEAWMKFILSDNDDDTEEDILRPSGRRKSISPTVIQLPLTSSVVVHLSAKTSSSSQLEVATSSRAGAVTTPGHTNMNIADLSTYSPQLSNHTTQGSNQSSSDGLSDILSSVDQIPTQSAPSSTPSRPIRKFTFTKPPRFPSPYRGSSPETTAATAGSPIHIGRSFLNRVAVVATLKGGSSRKRKERQYERDIYSLEDDVESIEDD
jgi:hypothetical protein